MWVLVWHDNGLTMKTPFFPSQTAVFFELQDTRDLLTRTKATSIDVRLSCNHGSEATLLKGPVDYDIEHGPLCGASSISSNSHNSELWLVARDLLDQVQEQWARLTE